MVTTVPKRTLVMARVTRASVRDELGEGWLDLRLRRPSVDMALLVFSTQKLGGTRSAGSSQVRRQGVHDLLCLSYSVSFGREIRHDVNTAVLSNVYTRHKRVCGNLGVIKAKHTPSPTARNIVRDGELDRSVILLEDASILLRGNSRKSVSNRVDGYTLRIGKSHWATLFLVDDGEPFPVNMVEV